MRVLSIIPSLDPTGGGPVSGLKSYVTDFRSRGWTNEVVCLDAPDSPWLKDCIFPVAALGTGVLSIRYTPKLGRWIEEHAANFDVAIIHGVWNWASVGGGKACRAANLPYVLFSHGMLDPYFREIKPIKHWVKQVFWIGQGPVLRDAEYVLFTAQQEAELARYAFWGPSWTERVVKYGANAPPATGREGRVAAFRKKMGLKDNQPYLLFLSRIHPKKGADILVDAFARVANDYPDLHLIIAGPGPDHLLSQLKSAAEAEKVADRVHFPGMLQGDLKWGAMEGAEAFTLFTHQENFGIVLAESLAAQTPVITTTKTNIWQELRDTGAAIICDDTAPSATEALRQFLSLPSAQKAEMRVKARAGYEAQFTAAAASDDLAAVLTEVAEQNPRNNAEPSAVKSKGSRAK